MKLRIKIVSTLMSMCLALGVMGFAVWAAATQTMTITNTIDFVSVHVLSTVTGTVTGAGVGTFTNYATTSTLATDAEGKLGTWAIGDVMTFADETAPIVITIVVVNDSIERSLTFEISGQAQTTLNGTNIDSTNMDRAVTYSIDNAVPVVDATYGGTAVAVEATKTATIVITLNITDTEKSIVEFDNGFTFVLRNVT